MAVPEGGGRLGSHGNSREPCRQLFISATASALAPRVRGAWKKGSRTVPGGLGQALGWGPCEAPPARPGSRGQRWTSSPTSSICTSQTTDTGSYVSLNVSSSS